MRYTWRILLFVAALMAVFSNTKANAAFAMFSPQASSGAQLPVVTKGVTPAAATSTREEIIKIVTQIKRADYEGDRAALKRLYDELVCALAQGDQWI
jgi:hypothetical protein